jgi:hypothetical protein
MDRLTNKNALRARAQRKMEALLTTHGHKCHWCGERVIYIRSVPVVDRIKTSHFKLHFRGSKGKVKIVRIATVDHVKPLEEGGDYRLENLVLACGECNQRRARKTRAPHNLICRRCGAPTKRRWCPPCRRTVATEFFLANPSVRRPKWMLRNEQVQETIPPPGAPQGQAIEMATTTQTAPEESGARS